MFYKFYRYFLSNTSNNCYFYWYI